eukprot:CAMPEP_0119303118 /NCGR_PEP_ID=MMETSP1333-20130426/4601_1 /TAXON_ID=418940 /ORGANISM="Scyphosphaera apsteinii, Strain RCC1455" /LENGTH=803 /DNA_ID=CAMNT_0007305699 /DNA_START=199 /DNA_END=2610 /DNA_ORIENTATION=-
MVFNGAFTSQECHWILSRLQAEGMLTRQWLGRSALPWVAKRIEDAAEEADTTLWRLGSHDERIASLQYHSIVAGASDQLHSWRVDWVEEQEEQSGRKLSVQLLLSEPSGFIGGELWVGPERLSNLPQGSLVIFPSVIPSRTGKIASGRLIVLRAWVRGRTGGQERLRAAASWHAHMLANLLLPRPGTSALGDSSSAGMLGLNTLQLLHAGRWHEAVSAARKAISLAPALAKLERLSEMAALRLLNCDSRGAATAFSEAVALAPATATFIAGRVPNADVGTELLQAGMLTEAVGRLRGALADPARAVAVDAIALARRIAGHLLAQQADPIKVIARFTEGPEYFRYEMAAEGRVWAKSKLRLSQSSLSAISDPVRFAAKDAADPAMTVYEGLVSWVRANGGYVDDKMAFKSSSEFADGGVNGMWAIRDIQEGTLLSHVPNRTMLVGGYCWLIEKLRKEESLRHKSFFWPYLQSMLLRQPQGNPGCSWSASARALLAGIPPYDLDRGELLFQKCVKHFKTLLHGRHGRLAALHVTERAESADCNPHPTRDGEHICLAMIPMMDLFNHHNLPRDQKGVPMRIRGMLHTEVLPDGSYEIRSLRRILAGEQIFNWYAPTQNRLLSDRGFIDLSGTVCWSGLATRADETHYTDEANGAQLCVINGSEAFFIGHSEASKAAFFWKVADVLLNRLEHITPSWLSPIVAETDPDIATAVAYRRALANALQIGKMEAARLKESDAKEPMVVRIEHLMKLIDSNHDSVVDYSELESFVKAAGAFDLALELELRCDRNRDSRLVAKSELQCLVAAL